jgi:uncharacterized protein (TIGR02391 family)
LLQTENRLIASGSGSATEWSYEISETIVEFGDVDSVEDYVAVSTKLGEQHDESMKALAVSADSVFTSSIPVITPNVVMLDVDSLHPRINTACLSLLISNHYGSAVLEAAKAFAELLRERSGQCETETGKRLDGTRLVEQATVVLMDGISDKQVRQHIEVTRDLGRAMMIGYRNPSAHKLNELPSEEALEAIATFSMLCRRVDATPSAHQVENVQ